MKREYSRTAIEICAIAVIAIVIVIFFFLLGMWLATKVYAADWQLKDIGAPNTSGSMTISGEQITIAASGADIWGTSDQFTFVYQPLNADGAITAKVDTLVNTHSWAKAGVMMTCAL